MTMTATMTATMTVMTTVRTTIVAIRTLTFILLQVPPEGMHIILVVCPRVLIRSSLSACLCVPLPLSLSLSLSLSFCLSDAQTL